MDIRKFSRAVASIIPTIHLEFVKKEPNFMLKQKITFPQMIIINILRNQKGCKMSDISKMLGVTKGAVTGITDRLIKSGLLRRTRSKIDRRVVRVELTPKGLRYAKRFEDFKLKTISSIFSNISQKERIQYLAILKKLQRNILAKLR